MIASLVIGGGMGIGGMMLGNKLAEGSVGPNPNANPQKFMETILQKKQEGKPISAEDVFALRVAQNPMVEAKIENQYGDPFSNLRKSDRKFVMTQYRALAEHCERDAQICNQADANVNKLMFGMMPAPSAVQELNDLRKAAGDDKAPRDAGGQQLAEAGPTQGSFAERVSRRGVMPGGFAEMVLNQRANATPEQVLPRGA